jgi:predicted ATP-grasp superfamily ATP-dependent carboligase
MKIGKMRIWNYAPASDTSELRKQGAALKTRMEKIIRSLAEQQEQAESPASVREGVMYG